MPNSTVIDLYLWEYAPKAQILGLSKFRLVIVVARNLLRSMIFCWVYMPCSCVSCGTWASCVPVFVLQLFCIYIELMQNCVNCSCVHRVQEEVSTLEWCKWECWWSKPSISRCVSRYFTQYKNSPYASCPNKIHIDVGQLRALVTYFRSECASSEQPAFIQNQYAVLLWHLGLYSVTLFDNTLSNDIRWMIWSTVYCYAYYFIFLSRHRACK